MENKIIKRAVSRRHTKIKLNLTRPSGFGNVLYFSVSSVCLRNLIFRFLTTDLSTNCSEQKLSSPESEADGKTVKEKKTKPLMSHSLHKLIKQHENWKMCRLMFPGEHLFSDPSLCLTNTVKPTEEVGFTVFVTAGVFPVTSKVHTKKTS